MNRHRCNNSCKKDCKEGCDKEWTREFVVKNFAKSFVAGEWKKMKEKVCFDTQKALLPATLGVVEERKEIEKLKSEISEIDRMLHELSNRRRNLKDQITQGGSVVGSKVKESHFVRPCSSSTCRGYLDTHWKCGLCEENTCSDCNTIKSSDHICNEDEKATFEVLKKDTKACPKCHVGIHKILGCDQMWCTQCHTGFSWITGRIETNIHNPHFFEFIKNSTGSVPRNNIDIECGRELDSILSSRILRQFKNGHVAYEKEKPDKKKEMEELDYKIRNILQKTIHVNRIESVKYRTNNVADHLELRVSYLKQEIDDKYFASRIQQRDKAFEKKKDIFNILRLVVQTITDSVFIASNIMLQTIPPSQIFELAKKFCNEVDSIIVYANDLLAKHSEIYLCKKKCIDFHAIAVPPYYNGDVLVSVSV